jgi:hypothetical protein
MSGEATTGSSGGTSAEAVPQSLQNRLSDAFSEPQTRHSQGSGAPHSPQNFLPSSAKALQRMQIMQVPTDKAAISCIPPGEPQQVTGVLAIAAFGHSHLPSCKNLPKIKKGRHVGSATMSESLAISVGGRRRFG